MSENRKKFICHCHQTPCVCTHHPNIVRAKVAEILKHAKGVYIDLHGQSCCGSHQLCNHCRDSCTEIGKHIHRKLRKKRRKQPQKNLRYLRKQRKQMLQQHPIVTTSMPAPVTVNVYCSSQSQPPAIPLNQTTAPTMPQPPPPTPPISVQEQQPTPVVQSDEIPKNTAVPLAPEEPSVQIPQEVPMNHLPVVDPNVYQDEIVDIRNELAELRRQGQIALNNVTDAMTLLGLRVRTPTQNNIPQEHLQNVRPIHADEPALSDVTESIVEDETMDAIDELTSIGNTTFPTEAVSTIAATPNENTASTAMERSTQTPYENTTSTAMERSTQTPYENTTSTAMERSTQTPYENTASTAMERSTQTPNSTGMEISTQTPNSTGMEISTQTDPFERQIVNIESQTSQLEEELQRQMKELEKEYSDQQTALNITIADQNKEIMHLKNRHRLAENEIKKLKQKNQTPKTEIEIAAYKNISDGSIEKIQKSAYERDIALAEVKRLNTYVRVKENELNKVSNELRELREQLPQSNIILNERNNHSTTDVIAVRNAQAKIHELEDTLKKQTKQFEEEKEQIEVQGGIKLFNQMVDEGIRFFAPNENDVVEISPVTEEAPFTDTPAQAISSVKVTPSEGKKRPRSEIPEQKIVRVRKENQDFDINEQETAVADAYEKILSEILSEIASEEFQKISKYKKLETSKKRNYLPIDNEVPTALNNPQNEDLQRVFTSWYYDYFMTTEEFQRRQDEYDSTNLDDIFPNVLSGRTAINRVYRNLNLVDRQHFYEGYYIPWYNNHINKRRRG